MPAASAHRSRHPVVLLFVGLLLVCDVVAARFLRRRPDTQPLFDASR